MISRRRLHSRIKSLQTEVDILFSQAQNAGQRWADLEERVYLLEQRADAAAGTTLPEVVEDQPYGSSTPVPDRAAALSRAITNERVVMFRYTKEGETDWELRQLSPYEIIKAQNGIVVRGWCHDREEIRSFRLDRMNALTVCDLFKGSDQDASLPVLRYRKPISS